MNSDGTAMMAMLVAVLYGAVIGALIVGAAWWLL